MIRERAHKIKEWWDEAPANPAPRGRWITTQIGVILIFFLTLLGLYREQNARQDAFAEQQRDDVVTNCQQRVDAVNSIRGVFLDVYNFIEENSGETPNITALRARLDVVLPAITVEDCVKEFSASHGE